MDITIGLPMYGGAGGLTVRSLLSLQVALIGAGYNVVFDIESGGSIITKVRNRIARRFLDSGNDYLIFIDSDMVFDAADVFKLIDSDADVCAINYLFKTPKTKWTARPELNKEGQIQAVRAKDAVWVKSEACGTGFMAIHRRAMVKMADNHNELKYDDDGEETLALFDFAIIEGRYYGEDYLFCKRWKALGGDIWTLAEATVGHVGETAYTGNYQDYLKGQNNATS